MGITRARTVGQAVRNAYQGRLTQAELADRLGVEQSTVSKWSRDQARPTLEQIRDIEIVCGRPIGYIVRAAGFYDEPSDVHTAIDADPQLSDTARTVLHRAYEGALDASTVPEV